MDKYTIFMQQVVDFLRSTRLSGPIQGNRETDIDAVEQAIGKKLPLAMRAWYRVAGAVPPYMYDHDADYSLEDLKRAQETAVDLAQDPDFQWKFGLTIIPFSQRLGEQFLFVIMTEGHPDDPPVYHYMEGEAQPDQVAVAFTTYIRETWLEWLDFPGWSNENNSEIVSWRAKGYDDWMSRKRVVDALRQEAKQFRKRLLETVHQEDLVKGAITGPHAFQERWLREFSGSQTWERLRKEGLRMPFCWVDPPKG